MDSRLELLAPAGDAACLDAALRAGADAIYFGLDVGFNARARASNFSPTNLTEIIDKIHDHGRRGYLTLNTLIFDDELSRLEQIVEVAARAGVDAVIVQDLGVARLVKRLVPDLRLHASTQTTCTDSAAIALLHEIGAERITLARELSLREIADLVAHSPVELEVFTHGALCIAYSGQCLTSEAIGGRSANRGACAQACRLPYQLVVDGAPRDLAEVAYLLSPQDLDASQMVPELLASGVRAIKIEGRMKGPDYVAATTRLYRLSVDAALARVAESTSPATALGASLPTSIGDSTSTLVPELERLRELSAQAFSRGAATGFLAGIDHQALVEGTTCDHIGVEVGRCVAVRAEAGRRGLLLRTHRALERGDGILVQGERAGNDELGGRIWQIRVGGSEIESSDGTDALWVWLGPERSINGDYAGRRVFRTSASAANAQLSKLVPQEPERVAIAARLEGELGQAPRLSLEAADGRKVVVTLDHPLELARQRALDTAAVREKLERLGDTNYRLEQLEVSIPEGSILPISALNRGRRSATEQLRAAAHRPKSVQLGARFECELVWPDKPAPPAGLFVTCRTGGQAKAALAAGARGIYLDVLALTGLGPLLRELRELRQGQPWILGVALPRIRKPGEEKIDAYVNSLEPDAVLIRSLGSLASIDGIASGGTASPCLAVAAPQPPTWVGDFSLNATNSVSAVDLLTRPLSVFTPGYDLDAAQLFALLDSPLASYAEVVVHHPMPLFHMEHCVFAALLSDGKDHRDCGRPCEHHVVSLRDRTGVDLPLEADVGCRNTVFHGIAQSAADLLERLQQQGVQRFRIELVRETEEQTAAVVGAYAALIAGRLAPNALRQQLAALGLRLVRGSLRVVG